jgi:hypothetical protein
LHATSSPGGNFNIPDGFRAYPSQNGVVITVQITGVAAASAQRILFVHVAKPDRPELDFLVRDNESSDLVEVLIRELHPTVSSALTFRIKSVIDDILNTLTDKVVAENQQKLINLGYR